MSPITHINIPIELFMLPLKGRYEMSIVALAYNFKGKGLTMSNGKLAKVLRTSSRTIERVISKLRTKGIVKDSGTGKNDRCLRLSTDAMSVVSTGITSGVHTDTTSGGVPTLGVVTTDVTADHKLKKGKRKGEGARKRFVPPTPEQVKAYAQSIDYFSLDPEHFVDSYAAKGWMIGKSPMKSWKATVRTWKHRDEKDGKPTGPATRDLTVEEAELLEQECGVC